MNHWSLPDSTATEALGAALARSCPWDSNAARLLALEGDLGAGKTTLARGLLRALGITESIRSPTYTLIETYAVNTTLAVHVDLYRLHGPDQVDELGLRDYLRGEVLMLIEWPQRAGAALPMADIQLQLRVDGLGRIARGQANSDAGRAWLAALEFSQS